MVVPSALRKLAPSFGVVVIAGLAGCSGTTYGTGISPEEQTIKDVMSLASLGSEEKPPIDYKPRGGIVAPPSTNLPPPVDSSTKTAAVTAEDPNWPKDPDVEARERKAAKQAEVKA